MSDKYGQPAKVFPFLEVANPGERDGSPVDVQKNITEEETISPAFLEEEAVWSKGPEAPQHPSETYTPRKENLPPPASQTSSSPGDSRGFFDQADPLDPTGAFIPETVGRGVMILLSLAGLQRLIGFARAVWFCRYLPPEELGKWEILFSFLNLAAPMVILSLPGAFGRYAERYRHQGQLRSFLRQTALACAGLSAAAGFILWGAKSWLDQLLFAGSGSEFLLSLLPWTLASIISLNYLTELFTALRNVRLSSMLFFLNSLVFAGVGIALLGWWRNDAVGVTAAYGVANLLTTSVALAILRRNYLRLPSAAAPLPPAELWRTLLPFAFSVWIINLATNSFSMVDRYLIVHLAPGGPAVALGLVGQYHSARLLPLLLLSVFQMLGAMILPHMSADWERGQVERAGCRLRVALKLLVLGMTGLATLLLMAAPVLFQTALGGKFQAGQQVLPGTLCYCIWFGLAVVAQNYLWCAERTYLASLGLLIGLGTNVVLNIWLLPRWGLPGLVAGTALAHLAALAIMLLWAWKLGFRPDRALLLLLLLPAGFLAGLPGACIALGAVVVAGRLGVPMFQPEEKDLLHQGFLGLTGRWWPFSKHPSPAEPLP